MRKSKQLTALYLEALICEEGVVMDRFTKVEEICAQIKRQGTIRRSLNRAVKQATKYEEGGCSCQTQ